jgi:hypothetical protein
VSSEQHFDHGSPKLSTIDVIMWSEKAMYMALQNLKPLMWLYEV